MVQESGSHFYKGVGFPRLAREELHKKFAVVCRGSRLRRRHYSFSLPRLCRTQISDFILSLAKNGDWPTSKNKVINQG